MDPTTCPRCRCYVSQHPMKFSDGQECIDGTGEPLRRSELFPPSSAEPAPPTDEQRDAAHEHRCVVVHHYTPGHNSHPNGDPCRCGCGASRQQSEPMPEWSDTDGTFKCPQCGADWPHYHNEAGEPRELPLSPVQEEATPTLKSYADALREGDADVLAALLRRLVAERDSGPKRMGFEESRALEVLASTLPALLEASRDQQRLKFANADIEELREQLRGSISERETLTAQNEELLQQNERERQRTIDEDRRANEAETAVARLTTENTEAKAERDTFRDWFQNAEQARAVAIAERDSAQADLDVSLNLLERQEASLAHRATCIAQLESQLEAAKQFREAPTNG